MITAIVFWLNAKYKTDATVLFVGTVIIDICILEVISDLLKG